MNALLRRLALAWVILTVAQLHLAALQVQQAPTVPVPAAPTPVVPSPPPVPVVPARQANLPADKLSSNTDPSKEAVIFERYVTRVVFEADGTGTKETEVVVRVQSQAGVQQLAVLSFPYTSYNDTVEVGYMRVRKPDSRIVVTPAYNVQDMPAAVSQSAPMYSDLHEKRITVKALGVGDVLEYLVRYRTVKPEVPGQFWYEQTFVKTVIFQDERLEINVPRDQYVKVVSAELKPAIAEDGGRKIYTWKTSNLDLSEREAIFKRTEAPKPSVQVTTFKTWEEVGRWYDELQRPQATVTPQIRTKAAELTKGLTTDEEKIRAIYNYVSTRFHYVSLSFGIGRYQPHAAEDVLENEYGDCKDKHTLLATMLKAAGYEAWPVLINAVRKVDPDVPSPGQFNHVISVMPRGKTMLWLDTTPGVSPLGLLLLNLRDKEALVMPTGKPAILMTTPPQPPFASFNYFDTEGQLNPEGTLTAHVKMTMRGDAEVLYRLGFRNVPPSEWKDFAQRLSYALGFTGDVADVTPSSSDDTDKPFEYSYNYTRKTFGDWARHEILSPLPMFGIEGAATEEKKPEEPIKLGAVGEQIFQSKVTLPAGYTPKYSEKLDLTEDFAEYHATYLIDNGIFTAKRKMTIKKTEVPLSSWETYKKFCKALSDERDRYIDLTSGQTVYPEGEGPQTIAAASPITSQPNAEAARLAQAGNQAMQKYDFTNAAESFKQAIVIDPKFPGGHAGLGAAYFYQNNAPAGIEEWRKEEEYHPENLGTYLMLGRVLAYLKRNDEALQQFRRLLTLDPGNRDAALASASLLTKQKKDPEAIEILEKALTISPDSSGLQEALGLVYVRNKQTERGVSILKKGMVAESNPNALNSMAYNLAQENAGLELASEYGDKALRQVEAASLKAEGDDAGLANTQFLGAVWDTVGWTYFRKGECDKALPYVKAAWLLIARGDVGDHLAQIYQCQRKKDDAARQYWLALAASVGNSDEDKKAIRDRYQTLTGEEMSRLMGEGSVKMSAGEALGRVRTTHIANWKGKSTSATFTVVLSPEKMADVKFVEGDEALKPVKTQIAEKVGLEFPDKGPAQIVRRGILYCGLRGCDFTFLPPNNSRNPGNAYQPDGQFQ